MTLSSSATAAGRELGRGRCRSWQLATFREQFEATMGTLDPDRRGVHVFVSSIPNLLQLWTVLHTNPAARLVWGLARICQSLLASSNGDAQRPAGV